MSNNLKLLAIKYLTPLVYATLFYFILIVPRDGSFVSVITFLSGFYLANVLLWADAAVFYKHYNELQTEPKQLITRSLLFIGCLLVLGLFVITSTTSYIGHGLVLGLGISILAELYFGLANITTFQQRFLFQMKKTLTEQEIKRLVGIFAVGLLILSIQFFF